MARPRKQTVDYFPHYCKCGRTIFILENRFGNDGYAFWFKLLEILGDAEGHYYNCSNCSNWAFLLAKTHVDDKRAEEIINVLIDLGKIDGQLWQEARVLWIGNFVRNLTEVYRTRHTNLPEKPSLCDLEQPAEAVCSVKSPQKEQINEEKASQEEFSTRKPTKEKERIEKERKEYTYPYQDIADKWNSVCGAFLPKVQKLSESRKQKIKARLHEFGRQEAWMPTIEALFDEIVASDFLCGRNNNGWTATFDWVFENPKNWVKVMEGNYSNHRGGKQAAQQPDVKLGVGEFIDNTGRRTYGTGKATIPNEAPPRPSEYYCWNESTKQWVLL
ncbi:Lin1244/Lin1753 domain-containing protein [Bacteroides sp.]|uniref:Lin1244/Lin1753 domain-containing protein n=1 Tax=Bacteroides sp. TaxID=29523 RepID=UPI003AAE6CBF